MFMLVSMLLRLLVVFKLLYFKQYLATGTPKGHLQPLGSHRLPEAVEERSDIPQPSDFWNDYVKVSKPVVFRGAARHSKAFHLWTDEYLKEIYGKLEVRLERKVEKSGRVPVGAKGLGRDTIEHFIDHYHGTNNYIVSELPTPMWSDINVQPCLTCGTFVNRLVEVDLWMSGGGSQSLLHKDAFNAINCLYNGTKQWKMIEYKYESMIYKVWEPEQEIGGFSVIDVNAVDLIKYPKIAHVPWSFVEINAGDCLFLPKSCYHQVNSFGTQNSAVSILFSRFDDMAHYDSSGCHSSSLNYVPLSQFDVDWQYPGYGNMTMGNIELEVLRDVLNKRVNGERRLTFKEITSLFKEFAYRTSDSEAMARKIFSFIPKNTTTITSEDIASWSKNDLRTMALLMERYEPSNTYTYEYSFVKSADIRTLIDELIQQDSGVILNKFLKGYTEELGGTEQFALQIFRGFLPKDDTMATVGEVTNHLDSVLRPYVEYSMKVESPDVDDDHENLEEGEEEERAVRDEL